jgi:hypothetical protein
MLSIVTSGGRASRNVSMGPRLRGDDGLCQPKLSQN